ncbi:hypothetical protein, partial [Nocardia asiatica]|uniref:hypothetical protein n=1 Tax=Nocardia asiatica TaxID=209252 RepID=UPI0024550D61
GTTVAAMSRQDERERVQQRLGELATRVGASRTAGVGTRTAESEAAWRRRRGGGGGGGGGRGAPPPPPPTALVGGPCGCAARRHRSRCPPSRGPPS